MNNSIRSFLILILFSLLFARAVAGSITGRITDSNNEPLAFSSITVKGTTQGTSANSLGDYVLNLNEGEYLLIAQHVGYKSAEQKVVVGKENLRIDFKLNEQKYDLGNVTVKRGEDPVYNIIRNAIKKRSYYEKEIKKCACKT